MEITREIAEKVRDTVDAGLVSGIGEPVPGQMCVEAAVCYAMGLPHSDQPSCVAPVLRRLKIALNDKSWSSPQARAAGLRRLAVAQLGSAGVLDEREFTRRVAAMTIRTVVPLALRAAATRVRGLARLPEHAERGVHLFLEGAAVTCERDGSRDAARKARAAAYAADAAYAAADAAAAAYAAADADAAAYAAAAAYPAALRAAARAAADKALAPTVAAMQDSAIELFTRMVRLGRDQQPTTDAR